MKKITYLLLIVAILGLAACSNPVDEDADHAEAESLNIKNGSDTIVSVVDGVATGQLTITEAEDAVTYQVEFVDGEGNVIHESDLGEEFTLAATGDDDSIATFTISGRFGFALDGIAAGTTELEVQLLHHGHNDFRTPKITVVVTQ